MGLRDMMKNATDKASSIANAAQSRYTEMQQNAAIKKEEQNKKMEEMKGRIAEYEGILLQQITDGFSGIPYFSIEDNLLDFTKEFFERLLLPANSVSASKITMYPYSDKILKAVKKSDGNFDSDETPAFQFNGDKGEFIVMTASKVYFSFVFPENPTFYGHLCIDINMVSSLEFEYQEGNCEVICNGATIFTNHKANEFDVITVGEYIRRLKEKDFEITETQVDELIKTKIGDKIQKIIRQYTFEDELLVYFAWGLDSITAKDFIVCTNKQLLMLDREMLGATKNVKQFYYEDITSMGTDQKTNGVLDFALTAALKLCNVTIYVAGAQEKIQTLFTYEAERVIRVYQEYRRSIKQDERNAKQVVIQQSAPEEDVFAKLEKLNKLKEAGILTEEEFNTKKAELLDKM